MELGKIPSFDQNKNYQFFFHHLTLKKQLNNGKEALLRWSSRNGYPRATLVFDSSIKEFNRENAISYPMDSVRLMTGLRAFIEILDKKENDSVEMSINYPSVNNGTVVNNFIGKLIFGYSNTEGAYIIATRGNNGVKFTITGTTAYIKFSRKGEESDFSAETAKEYAGALIASIEQTYLYSINTLISDREPAPQTQQPQQEVQVQNTTPVTQEPVTTQPVEKTTTENAGTDGGDFVVV